MATLLAKTPGAKPPTAVSAVEMGARQREISVSEFFTKNRHLLGFDNPRKALLTCVKEAVDNALDASEEAGILPEVVVKVDAMASDGAAAPPASQATRFRVTVVDHGPGIVRQQIPPIFAKLLYGSNFHRLRMSRGQQGIGISAAGMYAQLTTGKPVKIVSRTSARAPANYFEVQIDTKKNEPRIFESKKIDWENHRGTQVTLEIEGRHQKGRASVDEYLAQTAIANPHVRLVYHTPEGDVREYPRTIQELPPPPREIKPHPYGIEFGVLLKMLHDTRSQSLGGFLAGDFSRVSPAIAQEICGTATLSPEARPRSIHGAAAEALYKAIQSTKIMAPPSSCISPIGETAILHGLYTQIKGEFYTAVTRPPAVYRGNPFIIEAGLAYGKGPEQTTAPDAPATPLAEGEQADDDGELARVIRYANRVPLLYQQSACATFKAVLETAWRNYGIPQSRGALPAGPMVVFVHMASVWVPFTSESKEAIADYDEIRKEIKLALQECGRRLGVFLRRRERAKSEFRRRNIFELYIEEVVEACARLKGGTIAKEKLRSQLQKIATKRTGGIRTDEILGRDRGPDGLPHSIIITPDGVEGEAPALPGAGAGAAFDEPRPETESPESTRTAQPPPAPPARDARGGEGGAKGGRSRAAASNGAPTLAARTVTRVERGQPRPGRRHGEPGAAPRAAKAERSRVAARRAGSRSVARSATRSPAPPRKTPAAKTRPRNVTRPRR
jgi:DNA topoisomerase VI subunit B